MRAGLPLCDTASVQTRFTSKASLEVLNHRLPSTKRSASWSNAPKALPFKDCRRAAARSALAALAGSLGSEDITTDVVVVGAGVIGLSVAHALLKDPINSFHVTLVDQKVPCSGATGAGKGLQITALDVHITGFEAN